MAEILNRRLVRTSKLVTAVIVATGTLLLQQGAASSQAPTDEAGVVFGAKIVDIALTFDEVAKQSLAASPETGVPGKMSFTGAVRASASAAARA